MQITVLRLILTVPEQPMRAATMLTTLSFIGLALFVLICVSTVRAVK
jgi:hypothetical protein